jgi:hypothetical protein
MLIFPFRSLNLLKGGDLIWRELILILLAAIMVERIRPYREKGLRKTSSSKIEIKITAESSSALDLLRFDRIDPILVVDLLSVEGRVEDAGELEGGLGPEEVAVVLIQNVDGAGHDLVDFAATPAGSAVRFHLPICCCPPIPSPSFRGRISTSVPEVAG